MFVVLASEALGGCGRYGFDEVADDDDAGASIQLGPYHEGNAVPGLSSDSSQDDPTLTADLLEIYFDSARTGTVGLGDIWTSRRATADSAWEPVTNVAALNTTADEDTPELSSDGLTLTFARASAAGDDDIWMTERPDRGSSWRTPWLVTELASSGNDYGAVMDRPRTQVFFTSDRDGPARLYVATRGSPAEPFGAAVPIDELASPRADRLPWVNDDGSIIFFESTRGADLDIYASIRPAPGEPFAAPVRVGGISTAGEERAPWVSQDLGTVFFARRTASGLHEIHITRAR